MTCLFTVNGTSVWVTAEKTEELEAGILEPKCTRFCNVHADCPGYEVGEQLCMNRICVEKVCPMSIENGGVHLLNNGTNGTAFGSTAIITCM